MNYTASWRTPPDRQLRQFGLLCLLGLPMLGWWWQASPAVLSVLVGLAGILAGLSVLQPQLIRPLFVSLSVLTAPLGRLSFELALWLIYWAIFLPLGLLFRIARRDRLELRMKHTAQTYWTAKSEPKNVENYFRRY